MKLVLSTSWWPAGPATYLLRAAMRAGHEVRKVGPTSGDHVNVWEHAVTIPGAGIASDIEPKLEPTPELQRELDAKVLDAARWCDLWIDVDGGWFAYADLPARRRVFVGTDPHCASWCPRNDYVAQRTFIPHTRDIYIMQSRYCQPREGWLPYAFDPEWFRPDASVARAFDVSNLGASYPERWDISEALEKRGLRVLGPGRTCMADEHRKQICSAPVAIVWPLSDDLPCRVFEALACERTVVTRVNPEIRRLGLGGAVVERHTVEDVIEAADQLARLGEGRDKCAREFAAAVRPHTWDARLQQLIEGG